MGSTRRLGSRLLHAASLLALTLSAAAAADDPSWSVASGDVRVLCPLTIGGSFEARTSRLSGTLGVGTSQPIVLRGALSVDLRTLDSGIGLRNEHMRGRYLEVDKGEGFATAVLSDIRLTDAKDEGFQGATAFNGSLSLHGTSRPVAGRAQVRRDGNGVRVEASFPVLVPEFGIEKPRYLGVGVKDEVQVKVSFVATPATPAGGSR
jgi:hypothetical protein